MNIVKESAKYFKKYTPFYIFCLIIGSCGIFFALLAPMVLGLVVDYVMTPLFSGNGVPAENATFLARLIDPYVAAQAPAKYDYTGILLRLCVMLAAIQLIRYAVHYMRWNTMHSSGVASERILRRSVFHRMITQNTTILSKYTAGELLSISNGDIVMVKEMYFQISHFIDSFLWIGLSAFFLLSINPYLIILPAAGGIVMMLLTVRYTRKMRVVFNGIRSASIELNSLVSENINGVRVIRAFAREDYEKGKFNKKNENYREALNFHAETWSKYTAFFSGLSQFIQIGSLVLGVIFVLSANPAIHISVGAYVAFMAYIVGISNPMMNLANIAGALQQAAISGNRMFTFLNTNNAIKDPENPVPIEGAPHIKMRSATLQLDDKFLLKNIDLDVPYGKSVGIMGKTGSGKSALLKTFMRFYETTEGETMINGVNIKNVAIDDLRRQFSYVPQDVFLFSDTVESNIAFADPDCPHEKITAAAEAAEAGGFIEKLPQGYDTVVGERGLGLSGGQKQRVSIARALLKDAPIIIFDDSTSALDMETEKRIFTNLRASYAGRTILIAAHRASSVADCDEILYMEDGSVAERGTLAELLALGGKFAAVYDAQSASSNDKLQTMKNDE